MSFRIVPLEKALFASFFALDDAALAAAGGLRRIADRSPGFPCRVSLQDAAPGERVLLVHFEHQPARTPFRASHAVYVREAAVEARLDVDGVPAMLRSRLLSVRAFDGDGMLVGADVVDGPELERGVAGLFSNRDAAYLHVHFAKPGCYAARVERA